MIFCESCNRETKAVKPPLGCSFWFLILMGVFSRVLWPVFFSFALYLWLMRPKVCVYCGSPLAKTKSEHSNREIPEAFDDGEVSEVVDAEFKEIDKN